MKVGMLWLDDNRKRSFEEKVQRAADYYHAKYGRQPEVCYVNKGALANELAILSIQVKGVVTVLPHHFWLGMLSPQDKAA